VRGQTRGQKFKKTFTKQIVILAQSAYMSAIKYIKPTESELEILQVLWQKGLASVREVHEELSKTKEAGYTTTLKLMQIMNEKGLVKRDDSVKTHIYQPAVTKEKTQKHMLGKMINTLFGGSATELVIQALGNHKATADELEEIQKLLTEMKNQ
jgi:BlaI family transcriptional regulator, penicillinase repressor